MEAQREIDAIFKAYSGYDAHDRAAGILKDMSRDTQVLQDILRTSLTKSSILNATSSGPVVSFDIKGNHRYRMFLNAFYPLPDRRVDISHNWIHHHGERILSTVNTHGVSGYDSMLFDKVIPNNCASKDYHLKISKEYSHTLHNLELIPAFVPHVVFIPRSLTLTLTIWSPERFGIESLRGISWAQTLKKSLSGVAGKANIKKPVKAAVRNSARQFAPNGHTFRNVGHLEYTPSVNTTVVQNIFYLLRQVNFNDESVLRHIRTLAIERNRSDVVSLVGKFLAGELISDRYDPAHLNTPGINFSRDSIKKAAINDETLATC